MCKSRIYVAACLLAALCCNAPVAEAAGPQGLTNLALGKKYTLTPAPHYQYCTDPGDAVQLTDGVYTQGYFWTQKSTVGWSHVSDAVITIDLGAAQPICGVSYNTAAGAAGVTWPVFIPIFVSDDGKDYYAAGELVELDAVHGLPPAAGYHVRRFWTDRLATHGRFVKLVIVASGAYSFVDEIEVYRGPDALRTQPFSGPKISSVKQFARSMANTICVRRRLRHDLAAVREQVAALPDKTALLKELDAISAAVDKVQLDPAAELRTVFPLNDLHKRIFAVQAAVWRAAGQKPLVIWQKNRWDMLSPTEKPAPGGAKLEVAMMQNEWRGAAFNLSNAGAAPVEVKLAVQGLPGGPTPPYLAMHEVVFTDTKSGVPVAAAMPEARRAADHYVIALEPGMTKQVWCNVHSRDLPAGTSAGEVVIEPGGQRVPLTLKVYPFRFPDQPTLHLCGWDYTNNDRHYEVTPENQAEFIRVLREHYVDSPWATNNVMPCGKYDQDGNMIEPPDTANFEKWRKRWPGARKYLVFSNVGKTFAGFAMNTPPFEKAVAAWITWWVDRLAQWNIQPDQLGLLLVDEPREAEQDAQIVTYAKVIRRAQPKVLVWNDPIWHEPWKAAPELFSESVVLCPNLPMWISSGPRFAEFFVKQRDAGRELWYYSCSGPGKLLDPYAYHRMQHWFCWKYDAKGSGFWAFGDSNGAPSWNEYAATVGAYTPLFLDAKTVTAGKHMEAIREGMEDYEYLRMLRDRLAELRAKGVQGDAVAAAQKLLDAAAERVTSCMTPSGGEMRWAKPKDRGVADQVRVEVLDALAALPSP